MRHAVKNAVNDIFPGLNVRHANVKVAVRQDAARPDRPEVVFFTMKAEDKKVLEHIKFISFPVEVPFDVFTLWKKRMSSDVLGIVDFRLEGKDARTVSIVPKPIEKYAEGRGMVQEYPNEAGELMLLVRGLQLAYSAKALEITNDIRSIGTSIDAGKYTQFSTEFYGLESGKLYPVGQFIEKIMDNVIRLVRTL